MGHTSGLGKGLLILAAVVLGVIAVFGLISYGLGALLHSPIVSIVAGAVLCALIARWFRSSPRGILFCAVSGAAGGIVASLASAVLGSIMSVMVGAVVMIVALSFCLTKFRDKKPNSGNPN